MRVLVIGASGFIGRHLVRRLSAASAHNITATYRSRPPASDGNAWHQVELTDPSGLQSIFQHAQPELVIHLAALADVMTAEREPERAAAVNVAATSEIARLSELCDARLLFVSTEYVFDGNHGLYREDEPPNPVTQYGRTKWQGEQQVAELATGWSILRTSIVYGWPEPGQRNYANLLIESLRKGDPWHATTDVYRTPVYVEHLADAIVAITEVDVGGILHVAGADWVSMYDFAVSIARAFNLHEQLIIPTDSAAAKATGSDSPDLLGLDCVRTVQRLGLPHPGLREGLTAMRAAYC